MLNYKVIDTKDSLFNQIGILINCSQLEATLEFKHLGIYKTYTWDKIIGEKICI